MAKRVSPRKIKIHNQYTYEQAADALGVSVQTVWLWRLSGLEVLDSQKPHLILGFALKDYLTARSNKAERRLDRDQFLCLTCNPPRRAYGGMADYAPTPIRGGGWRRSVRSTKAYAASMPARLFAPNSPQS